MFQGNIVDFSGRPVSPLHMYWQSNYVVLETLGTSFLGALGATFVASISEHLSREAVPGRATEKLVRDFRDLFVALKISRISSYEGDLVYLTDEEAYQSDLLARVIEDLGEVIEATWPAGMIGHLVPASVQARANMYLRRSGGGLDDFVWLATGDPGADPVGEIQAALAKDVTELSRVLDELIDILLGADTTVSVDPSQKTWPRDADAAVRWHAGQLQSLKNML